MTKFAYSSKHVVSVTVVALQVVLTVLHISAVVWTNEG